MNKKKTTIFIADSSNQNNFIHMIEKISKNARLSVNLVEKYSKRAINEWEKESHQTFRDLSIRSNQEKELSISKITNNLREKFRPLITSDKRLDQVIINVSNSLDHIVGI